MKKECDFSKGVRGKFYRPNARINLPVYLDSKVQRFVQNIAASKQSDVSTIVNKLLRSDMQLVESLR